MIPHAPRSVKGSKSQSALEYMMTYGWAILIIVIVAAVLYSLGIFSPSSSIGTTVTGFSGLGSPTALCMPNGGLRLRLGDNIGTTINITSINVTVNGATSTIRPNRTIPAQGTYIFYVPNVCGTSAGARYSFTSIVTYTEPGQTFPGPYFSTGAVSGTVSSLNLPREVAVFNTSSLVSIIKSNMNFPKTSSVSFSLWIDVENEISGGINQQFDPVSLGNSSYCDYQCGALRFNSGFPYNLQMVRGTAQATGFPANTNIWYQIVGVYNYSSNTTNLYVNGTFLNGGNAGPGQEGSDSVFIGVPVGGDVTPVILSDVQVYTIALTPPEISLLYRSGPAGGPVAPGVFGWWPLNGTAKDYSGNGNNGVATGVSYTSDYVLS